MKKSYVITICLLIMVPLWSMAQDKLPVPATPGSWVNDYAGVFSTAEASALDRKLNEFEYRSSTQIFVVTLDDNGGYPASMLAPMIGEQWGVGQKGKDNGLLVVVDIQERDVFISTGYGLEEFIPDAIASRIVQNEILPNFKSGNYYGGIDAATDVMISLLDGQFTADEYRKQSSSGGASTFGGLIFMIILFSILFGGRRRSAGMGRSNLPLWIALGMMSGNRHSGSWSNFSSGSSGGGFGGFSGGGGGSFGGGGAGGSW
ncbi:MAG: TPM domain-containing protein [Bacteroidales bacterium]|nr:TPM domain-containing protein [Bacteroidales bacterium]